MDNDRNLTEGERIKKLRKSLDLTQDKFGERLGLKRNTISQIESGTNNVTEQMRKSICREFNVNYNWLLCGEGDMIIEVDKEDMLMQWAGEVLSEESTSFRKRLVKLLSALSDDEWVALENKLKQLYEED